MFSCKVEVSIFIQDKVTKQICKSKWFTWGEVHLVKELTLPQIQQNEKKKSRNVTILSRGVQALSLVFLNAIFSIYEQNILRFFWKISFFKIYFHYLLVPFSPNDFTMKWFFFFENRKYISIEDYQDLSQNYHPFADLFLPVEYFTDM